MNSENFNLDEFVMKYELEEELKESKIYANTPIPNWVIETQGENIE